MKSRQTLVVDTTDYASILAAYTALDQLLLTARPIARTILTRPDLRRFGKSHGYSPATCDKAYRMLYRLAEETFHWRHPELDRFEARQEFQDLRDQQNDQQDREYYDTALDELSLEVVRASLRHHGLGPPNKADSPRRNELIRLFLKHHGLEV